MTPPVPRLGLRARRGGAGRRTAAVLILFAWGGALGWLIRRHYLDQPLREGAAGWRVPPGSSFSSIKLGDRQVGIASLTIDTLAEGYRIIELATIDLPPLTPGVPRRTTTRTEALYSRALQLREWHGDLLTEHGRLFTTGAVSGDTLLTLSLAPRGQPVESLRVALRRPVILPSAVSFVAASRGLPRPGSRLNLEVYDPTTHQLRTDRFTIAAESLFTVADSAEWDASDRRWVTAHADTLRAWRLDAVDHGLPVARWIDAAGMPVREVHPLGAVIQRSAFELVNTNYRPRPATPWDTSRASPWYGTTPSGPEPLAAMEILLRLADGTSLPSGLPALDGAGRRVGDVVRLGTGAGGEDTTEVADILAEPLLATDPALRGAALTLAQRAPVVEAFAPAAAAWVRRTIPLGEGPGLGPATVVLARRTGTAQERVRLVVALARAAGHPAREVWGLVLVANRWEPRPWAELWAGRWIPADPGEILPEPTAARLRLGLGAPARLLDLALRAGQIRIEILGERR